MNQRRSDVIKETQSIIKSKFSKQFNLVRKTVDLAESMLRWDEEDDSKKLSIAFLTRSIQRIKAIESLCRFGFGQDSLLLTRALYEDLIDLKFIQQDETRVKSFLDYDSYERWQLGRLNLKSVKQGAEVLAKALDAMEQEWLKVSEKFRTKKGFCSRWSCKSIEEESKQVGLEESYNIFYRFASKFVHPSSVSINSYVTRDESGVNLWTGSSDQFIGENLNTAVSVLLDMLSTLNIQFKAKKDKEIQSLVKDLLEVKGKTINEFLQ